ncbi:type VI secretion system Vgr family protein [Massilia sp. S19_KUP03_FR1]|uniref:type VI secretion system Vgr family protein n=1 Tax=Massilia sp. S19_KUP03_FR1 TaxID=3025503 RepID=UPI002FCDC1BF
MDAFARNDLVKSLARFSSTTRLYALTVGDDDVLVEAFLADEAIQAIGVRDVIALSTSAYLDLEALLGQPASLSISLADRSRTSFSGFITEASMLSCDGGFARYCLRIAPWMWRLEQVQNCRVWENKTVVEIIDDVFRYYQPQARWRWSSETARFMNDAVARTYCCQYRESDFDFIRRLLTEEGLCWRFEQDKDGHCCVLFSNSTQLCAVPEDPSSAVDGGVRYHGARPGERQDTVQAMHSTRSLLSTVVTVLSTDYKRRHNITASSPSRYPNGANTQALEVFDHPGAYAYADAFQARRYADLHMETLEARSLTWLGRSTVRTLRAGTRVTITDMPLKRLGRAPAFTVTRVTSIGINNLPPSATQALAALFEPLADILEEFAPQRDPDMLALLCAQATQSGYANCFDAIPADRPWRAQLPGAEAGLHPLPTAIGAQTALVVGPGGSRRPDGAREIYCDKLGRVRIRFHWQDETASCWVRVAQRAAGGSKSQFLPRIGQEVFVQFMENNIDRPVIVGALYNGQGEGGHYATPGGKTVRLRQTEYFARSTDHARVAQGNLAGTSSPVWHGASPAFTGHRNDAAQWGIRSKEFGGSGYNQLLFDDTDARGRVQLKSTGAATELNLGHLIHTADNYRGSFRGLGAELRTDAYGAVRAGAGLLITSYKIAHSAKAREPVGENAAGVAMLQQASNMAERFHGAATTHKTVGVAQAPLQSLLAAVSGKDDAPMIGAAEPLPKLAQPIIAVSAQGGLGAVAGQDVQLATGDAVFLLSGADTQFSTGGQLRVHAGQAIGMLGGAVKPGEGGVGMQLIAAQDDIDFQAQADTLTVQARDEVNVISANAHIDWAAAKSISLSTAGGANITIAGGNITVQCPGKLTIHAGVKSFVGPAKLHYPMPSLPDQVCVECLKKALAAGVAFTTVE